MKTRRSLIAAIAISCLCAAPLLAADLPTPHVRLPLDVPPPEIRATTPDGAAVSLASLKGKPIVLQFGSITEPLFRLRVPATEKLAAQYGDKVVFLILYEHEAHAADGDSALEENAQDGFDISAPTGMPERIALAKQALTRLDIKHQQLAIDAWNNATALRYGNFPNMTFIIDASGKLQAGYPWMDPKKVQPALDALLAGKPIPDGLRGSSHPATLGNPDFTSVSMDMSGYGAGAKLALVLDQMTLSPEQKAAIMPPLGKLITDTRTLRETMQGSAAPNAAAGGAGAGAAANSGTGKAASKGSAALPTAPTADVQTQLQTLRPMCKLSKPPAAKI